jgi:hypothetical protein
MTTNADIVKALGELSSTVATGSKRIDRLAESNDLVADRVTTLETKVEERTKDLVREDTLRAAISGHVVDCQTKKLDRAAVRGKPSSYPPRNHSKVKVAGVLGASGAGLGALGYAAVKLIEWLQALPQ